MPIEKSPSPSQADFDAVVKKHLRRNCLANLLYRLLCYRVVFSVSLCLIIVAIVILFRTVQEPRHQNTR